MAGTRESIDLEEKGLAAGGGLLPRARAVCVVRARHPCFRERERECVCVCVCVCACENERARARGGSSRVRGCRHPLDLQRYLMYKKTHSPRTLPYAYAEGLRGVLGGWALSYGRGTPVPLSSQYSTCKTVKTKFWPSLSD